MHANLIDPQRSFLLVIDVQQTYADKLFEWDRTVERSSILIRAARALEVPVIFTEQYPRGLGPTTPRILDALGDATRFEKRSLSCWGAEGIPEHLRSLDRDQAVLCGLETHACVSQTAHDMIDAGLRVHVPEDAIGSRKRADHEIGYQKMLVGGALPASVESVVLEWLKTADHPSFRPVQALLK